MNAALLRFAAAATTAAILLPNAGCYLRDDCYYPEVRWISPSDGDVGVELDTDVRAEFDRRMRPATFTSETFYVEQGTTRVPGTIDLILDDRVAVFTPAEDLEPDTLYRVTIRRSVESRYDRRLRRDVTWEFTTAAAPSTLLLANELLVASFRAHAVAAGFAPDEVPDPARPLATSERELARALSEALVGDGAHADLLTEVVLDDWRSSVGTAPDPRSPIVTAMRAR